MSTPTVIATPSNPILPLALAWENEHIGITPREARTLAALLVLEAGRADPTQAAEPAPASLRAALVEQFADAMHNWPDNPQIQRLADLAIAAMPRISKEVRETLLLALDRSEGICWDRTEGMDPRRAESLKAIAKARAELERLLMTTQPPGDNAGPEQTITRYDLVEHGDFYSLHTMDKAAEGEYVLYADHIALLAGAKPRTSPTHRFVLTWRNGAYYVSEPGLPSPLEVVDAASYDATTTPTNANAGRDLAEDIATPTVGQRMESDLADDIRGFYDALQPGPYVPMWVRARELATHLRARGWIKE